MELDHRPPGRFVPGGAYTGAPTAQSSGIGLLALTLQALQPRSGERFLEIGACTAYLAALVAELTGRQATGVEIDRHLVHAALPRLAAVGADVRLVTGDGLHDVPDGSWEAIASSFAVRRIPAVWLHRLAPGGRLRTTVTTGAPGWHATALVHRSEDGALSGRLLGELWGHVPDRATGWIPLPAALPEGAGRRRGSVLVPPAPDEAGFWIALAHTLPGVRRHWQAPGDDVVLVAGGGSRAVVAPDGSSTEEWGPRSLWREAEQLNRRWTAAGQPDWYRLEFTEDAMRAVGGPALSWERPLT